LTGGRLDPALELALELVHAGPVGGPSIDAVVAVEWSTMLLGGGHNPSAWLEIDGERTAHDVTRSAVGIDRITAGNDFLGIAVETRTDRPVDAWLGPIETVSNSEAGFELVYQGSVSLLVERLRLAPGDSWSLRISQQATIVAERFAAVSREGASPGPRQASASLAMSSPRRAEPG